MRSARAGAREIVSESAGEVGGYKEVVIRIVGDGVYGKLKFESGGHRVQRVPATETQGRIHTSACTVAALPEPDEAQAVQINPADLRIDTYRASGAGGQHVNKTDSAVRITHIPTGIVAECQDDRSQHRNKAKALQVLAARIQEKERSERAAKEAATRKGLIGSGDRSDRIRTYNFPQGRLTDHRINLTLYKLQFVMEGDLDDVIEACCWRARPSSWRNSSSAQATPAGDRCSQALAAAAALGLERLDAQLLLLHALGRSRDGAGLAAGARHGRAARAPAGAASCSCASGAPTGEPLAYIVGHKEFFGLKLLVDARVLVPRPGHRDPGRMGAGTAAVIRADPDPRRPQRASTCGTGQRRDRPGDRSMRSPRRAGSTAVDASADALDVARANARRLALQVRFRQARWLDGAEGRYDLIVCNPPYVAAGDPHLAALRHEPLGALVAGPDGLDDIRVIVAQAARPPALAAAGCCWNTATTRPRPCASCWPLPASPTSPAAATWRASNAAPAASGLNWDNRPNV